MKKLLFLFLIAVSLTANSQTVLVSPTSGAAGYAATTTGAFSHLHFYAGKWKDSTNAWFLKLADTNLFARKISLNNYLLKSDTASMLSTYAKVSQLFNKDYNDLINKPVIPTNNNQLTNGAGYLTSYTETDPTVPSYAKGLSSFAAIKLDTDPLYKSSSYVPTWGEITSKPTFATVATSGAYADLSGKPTIPAAQVQTDWNAVSGMGVLLNKPTVVQQFGTNYTKEWNGKATTTTSSNSYSFNISSAGFTSITSIQVSAYYNGGNSQTMPIPSVNSYSNTSVNIVIAESANTNVLVGGTVEGLTDFSRNGAEIFVTVKGN